MNHTPVMEFVLVSFSESLVLLKLHALLFTLTYLVALLENSTIILLTLLDQHLHTPMYFFLRHLSFLDLCLISATVPKSILNSFTLNQSISLFGCAFQLCLVIMMVSSEMGILTAMSFDRYVAICRPLHYETVMNTGVCVQLLVVSWISGGTLGILYSAATFSLTFCGSNKIHQFFCDLPALLRLTCSEEFTVIDVSMAIGICYAFAGLTCIVVSYVHIFSTVLNIPSTQSQFKAFSTCLPHLIVVITFLLTGAVAYLKPATDEPSLIDLVVSMFYSVMPPTLNPVIYCLRNKDIKSALSKILRKLRSSRLMKK